jgi:alpha-L-rhamnosidase
LTRPDGTYIDGLNTDGSPVAVSSQITNASAVVYGVAPRAHYPAIGAYIAGLGMQAPPQMAAEVLEALAATGRPDDVITRLTDTSTDGWAKILSEGATFTWEVWDPSDLIGDSMSHGWGSNVTVAIQQAVLGVQFTAPGGASVSITPPDGGLASARGTVPTPRGTLSVGWQRTTGARPRDSIAVTIPPGMTAVVRFPGAKARHLGAGHWHLSYAGS